jgi:hypothetical protein
VRTAVIIGFMQATYEDANLILKLYDLRREETLRKARSWFVGSFAASSTEEMFQKYAFGSQENSYVRMVISYWDMASSFVTSGVLNKELFFKSSGELLIVWEKVRPLTEGMRKMTGNPNAWSNLEQTGKAYIEFMGPEAYAGFQGMLARIAQTTAAAVAAEA